MFVANLLQEMEDQDMTIEEYYDEDVHYLRLFETEFPAIVYNDALASKPDFSPEPTESPQHIDEVNLKNETVLSEFDGEGYNVISFSDLCPFNVFSVNDSKLDTDNDDNIDIKPSSGDISIKPSHNVISIDVGPSITIESIRYVVPTGRVIVPTGRYVVPAGKKDEYEVWAIKMEYWITNNDMNIWKVIQNGNSLKRTRRYHDGRVIILPLTTADEHIAVQRESKATTTLLQSIPDDHVADFHYMDDARDIWNVVKARVQNLKKGIHKVALTLKNKGGLELLSFDDLYYKLKTLEVDIKGYSTFSSSQSAGPSHSAFVSTTSASKKISGKDRKIRSRGYDFKWQMAMLSVKRAKGGNDKQRYSSFKIQEIGKKEEDSKALITVDTLLIGTEHDGH
ncbi:hypothetical protein Tco_0499902 [Tanacetum coccineum]